MSPGDLGGLGALAVALFWVGLAIRNNARLTRMWRDTAEELSKRVATLERSYERERARRIQLEGALRDAGVPVPPRRDDDDAEPADHPAGGRLIAFPWRSRA